MGVEASDRPAEIQRVTHSFASSRRLAALPFAHSAVSRRSTACPVSSIPMVSASCSRLAAPSSSLARLEPSLRSGSQAPRRTASINPAEAATDDRVAALAEQAANLAGLCPGLVIDTRTADDGDTRRRIGGAPATSTVGSSRRRCLAARTAGCNYVKRSHPEDGVLDGIQPNIAEKSRKNCSRQYQAMP